jgi:hypothetical protein
LRRLKQASIVSGPWTLTGPSVAPGAGGGEHVGDRRGQQLAVPAGVDGGPLGEDPVAVGHGDRDRGGRGVEGEEHGRRA